MEQQTMTAAENARDRDTEHAHRTLSELTKDAPKMSEQFWRDSEIFQNWYADVVSQHSDISLEFVREEGERLFDGKQDYSAFGAYMFTLMTAYLAAEDKRSS